MTEQFEGSLAYEINAVATFSIRLTYFSAVMAYDACIYGSCHILSKSATICHGFHTICHFSFGFKTSSCSFVFFPFKLLNLKFITVN